MFSWFKTYKMKKNVLPLWHLAADGNLYSLKYIGTSHDDIDMFINEEDPKNLKFIAKLDGHSTPRMMTCAGEARRALIDSMNRAR